MYETCISPRHILPLAKLPPERTDQSINESNLIEPQVLNKVAEFPYQVKVESKTIYSTEISEYNLDESERNMYMRRQK